MNTNMIQDVPVFSSSIWPNDHWKPPDVGPVRRFDKFRCFVLCPFKRADTILPVIELAARHVGSFMDHRIEVSYAGNLAGSRAIHPDIWANVRQADIVIADITRHNPNVMYELGAAAAWRPIETVILIRDRDDGQDNVFDLQPARQVFYSGSDPISVIEMAESLKTYMLQCLARAPFRGEPQLKTPQSFEVAFDDGKDVPYMCCPGPGHRRLLDDYLEFGSPLYFPYSWLSPVGIRPSNVRVQAEMRFTYREDEAAWIGIAVRSQGYLANHEHLVWLRASGDVYRTSPGFSAQEKEEQKVGQIDHFDPESFYPFDIAIDQHRWTIKIGPIQEEVRLVDLPHVFPQGRIMFQARRSRAAVKNVKVEVLA